MGGAVTTVATVGSRDLNLAAFVDSNGSVFVARVVAEDRHLALALAECSAARMWILVLGSKRTGMACTAFAGGVDYDREDHFVDWVVCGEVSALCMMSKSRRLLGCCSFFFNHVLITSRRRRTDSGHT